MDFSAIAGAITAIGGGIAAIGTPAVAVYKTVTRRAMASEKRLLERVEKSNRECEERSKLLEKELHDLRDITIKANTEALRANTRALDRFIEHAGSGSGAHPATP